MCSSVVLFRVTQVRLNLLDGRQLSEIRRARAPEHLVRDVSDSGPLLRFLQDPKEKIGPAQEFDCLAKMGASQARTRS
jgi:hypothetical protein